MGKLILVRHTAVAAHWKGRCYGRSDVGLSHAGCAQAKHLATQLALAQPDRIVSSPLRRARFLAALLARELGQKTIELEPRIAECNFGAWEGRPWNEIYNETGSQMMGMVEAPDSFRPGGHGETTFEVRDRVLRWYRALPRNETILVVCHGGPIGALRGTLASCDVRVWPSLVPAYGEAVDIARHTD
jgi:broad specificity phosphatase PhoE